MRYGIQLGPRVRGGTAVAWFASSVRFSLPNIKSAHYQALAPTHYAELVPPPLRRTPTASDRGGAVGPGFRRGDGSGFEFPGCSVTTFGSVRSPQSRARVEPRHLTRQRAQPGRFSGTSWSKDPHPTWATTPVEAGAQLGDGDDDAPRSVTATLPTGPRPPPGWYLRWLNSLAMRLTATKPQPQFEPNCGQASPTRSRLALRARIRDAARDGPHGRAHG